MANEAGTVSPRDAIAAVAALIRAAWDVRTRRTGRLLTSLRQDDHARPAVRNGSGRRRGASRHELALARRIGDSVRYVSAGSLLRPRCLVQALAVKRLLDRRGLHGGRIRVGVRQNGDDILAHAWVEFQGQVVGDFPEEVGRYTDLRGLHVDSGGTDRSGAGAERPAGR